MFRHMFQWSNSANVRGGNDPSDFWKGLVKVTCIVSHVAACKMIFFQWLQEHLKVLISCVNALHVWNIWNDFSSKQITQHLVDLCIYLPSSSIHRYLNFLHFSHPAFIIILLYKNVMLAPAAGLFLASHHFPTVFQKCLLAFVIRAK